MHTFKLICFGVFLTSTSYSSPASKAEDERKAEMAKRARTFQVYCEPDMHKFCHEADKNVDGWKIKCISQHASEVSSTCANALKLIKSGIKKRP